MATEEWQPKRFPEGLSQGLTVTKHSIQPKYLKKDRTAMNSKAYASSLKSGSVKVYTKTAFGRVTLATSTLVDEEKGCAEWNESVILAESSASVYFVLHKTSDRWMLSAVLEDDVTASDIKIAVVKKRESASVKDWRLIQLWKSDLSLAGPQSHPFQVTLGVKDGLDVIYVKVGSVNNVIPNVGTTLLSGNYDPIPAPTTAGDYVVCVKCYADPAPADFPLNTTEITCETYPTTNTDSVGFIALALITATDKPSPQTGVNLALNQLVQGSLWAERHKYSAPNTATYFFYRV
jgi:hypothetical protein